MVRSGIYLLAQRLDPQAKHHAHERHFAAVTGPG